MAPECRGGYCGSTSAEKATSRCAQRPRRLDSAARTAATAGSRSPALTTTWARSAPPQPKQRGRAHHGGAGARQGPSEPRSRPPAPRPGPATSRRRGSDGRRADSERAPALQLARDEAAGVVARRADDRGGVGRQRLHQHPPAAAARARPAPRAARSARTCARRRGSRGSAATSRRRAPHRASRGEVVALGHHLGADQHPDRHRGEASSSACRRPWRCARRRQAQDRHVENSAPSSLSRRSVPAP